MFNFNRILNGKSIFFHYFAHMNGNMNRICVNAYLNNAVLVEAKSKLGKVKIMNRISFDFGVSRN